MASIEEMMLLRAMWQAKLQQEQRQQTKLIYNPSSTSPGPHVESGKILGYVVKPGQGFTQVAKDINSPKTKRNYEYSLGNRKIWWYEIANHRKNKKYTNGAKFQKGYWNKGDKGHYKLNMNLGDYLHLPDIYKKEEPDPIIPILKKRVRRPKLNEVLLEYSTKTKYQWAYPSDPELNWNLLKSANDIGMPGWELISWLLFGWDAYKATDLDPDPNKLFTYWWELQRIEKKIDAQKKAISTEVAEHSIAIDRYERNENTQNRSYNEEIIDFKTKARKVTELEMKQKIIKEEIIWVIEQMEKHPTVSY